MKPIKFDESNFLYIGGEQFNDLPCFINNDETISRWQLTWWERVTIFFTGRLWLRQTNYRRPLQAQLPQVESPFTVQAKEQA